MHHVAWVVAPVALAAVLAFSGATKVGKGGSLRSIIANLNLPAWLLPAPLARSIPYIEFALALGLLTPWQPVFGAAAVGTLVLVIAYWLLIARGLTISPRPECGCFGEVGDQRITGRTLARNTLLVAAAAAAVALAASGGSVWSLLREAGRSDWLWLALAVAASALTALVVGRGRSPETVAVAGHAPVATPAAAGAAHEDDVDEDDYIRTSTPDLLLTRPGVEPDSGPITLHELSAKRAQLLVFVNCYCASTTTAVENVREWQRAMPMIDVHLVFSVPIVGTFVDTVPPGTLLDHAGVTWRGMGLTSLSPSAVLLGADGYLAGGPVEGADDVAAFVEEIAEALREDPATEVLPEEVRVSEDQLTGDR
ncbi:methylamine utilization protein MauE [Knoellia sinensis KCTC 19936]|uniref:Methylamine utilization protein MauE n=1 Tax=Knoellia sinensis KCTC 19936 TaxID=1385520 RepID=A0A0A0JGE8_9MICO|nr:MauE/DoxX family redox-associated membrane protein [Knoellia sinensis]KGN34686.1 methylamine utilization protein MauE [Knoellia sinensis KCTC 19936]